MQSFKQYLFEENISTISYVVTLYISDTDAVERYAYPTAQSFLDDIESQIKYTVPYSLAWNAQGNMEVAFDLNTLNITHEYIKNILVPFVKELEKLLSDSFSLESSAIEINKQLPSDLYIDFDRIVLDFWGSNKTIDLTNISKQINCKTLLLKNMHKVVKGGLGILKIPKLINLRGIDLQTNKIPWVAIVLKHHKNGNDIFSCKEELVNTGYKEHAKL